MFDLTTVSLVAVAVGTALFILYTLSLNKKIATLLSETEQKQQEIDKLSTTYAPILSIEHAVEERRTELDRIDTEIQLTRTFYQDLQTELSTNYSEKKSVYDALLHETSILDSKLEEISYGLYTPVYTYSTSEGYKQKLEAIRQDAKRLIKENEAVFCPVEWTVSGSRTEGKRMINQYAKLMLRAFNGECDAAIARVSWNNIGSIELRINKAYEALNKLGSVNQISITQTYYNYKLAELRLEYELQEKLHQEREEQRMIREQMREEEKAQREIEVAQRKAEDEEIRYQKALAKATEEARRASGEQLTRLNEQIMTLEQALAEAQLQKERALSMAQQTKSGHVYVISNIGSFGEDVFKIGMTRRLEPMDRVRELGDASVPFGFDVHALAYSVNAPELEYRIHRSLMNRRINLINNRREFFNVSLGEIEQVFAEAGHQISLTKLAEAKEYRESVSIREAESQVNAPFATQRSVYLPATLD